MIGCPCPYRCLPCFVLQTSVPVRPPLSFNDVKSVFAYHRPFPLFSIISLVGLPTPIPVCHTIYHATILYHFLPCLSLGVVQLTHDTPLQSRYHSMELLWSFVTPNLNQCVSDSFTYIYYSFVCHPLPS
jgi:hypothetical protein